jgi:hypothetical protein
MLILCNLKTRESIFLASNFSSDNFLFQLFMRNYYIGQLQNLWIIFIPNTRKDKINNHIKIILKINALYYKYYKNMV